MTLTNEQRAERCGKALADYSNDDSCTNLVDWLADAMHWCDCNGHDFADVMDSAFMHFNAEIAEAAEQGLPL